MNSIYGLKDCVSHEESMIRAFMKEPEYAEYFLNEVISDGDINEIREVQGWYDEARARAFGALAQA